ncbi:MAG: disulfide bond formation protein B, partial [Cutibacterium acnes]|nr:disulfide bond formation protein B [Cutibacterium acnes]
PCGFNAHAIFTVIMWLFALIVVANLVMIVFLEGLHFLLPGDPACYELVQNCSPR